MTKKIMVSIEERLKGNNSEALRIFGDKLFFNLRCASPGIIKSFDSSKQTVSVQLAIKEFVTINGIVEIKKIPIIEDIPIYMPRAGNFVITMPIKEGDECLVVFSDTCIDSWYQQGGEENTPMEYRRHDLSDAFAIVGVWSQPNVISDYSEDSLEIRSLDSKRKIEVTDTIINVINDGGTVNVEGDTVNVKGDVNLGESSNTRKIIDERLIDLFNNHTHNYNPGPGSSTPSGVPNVPLALLTCATTKTGAK